MFLGIYHTWVIRDALLKKQYLNVPQGREKTSKFTFRKEGKFSNGINGEKCAPGDTVVKLRKNGETFLNADRIDCPPKKL